MDGRVRHQRVGDPEIFEGRAISVMYVVKSYGNLVDDAVLPGFVDARLDELGISAVDVVPGEDATNTLDTLNNRRLAGGRAVLREQEFEHVGRHDRVSLDLPDQVLSNDKAVEGTGSCLLVTSEHSPLAVLDRERGLGIHALYRFFRRDAHRSNPPNPPNPLSLRVS